MKYFLRKKIKLTVIFLIAIVIGTGLLLMNIRQNKISPAFAGTSDNVSGFAYSSNFGWISFNSTDCDANCAGPICTSDGVPAGCPSAGVTYPDYGVKIDNLTGDFSGYAWSSNSGWISFNRVDTGNPPAAPFNGGSGPIANMNSAGIVTGWAKVLSLGVDGWIKLRRDSSDAGAVAYGVTVDTGTKDFSGWAWNGDAGRNIGVGWISFNSKDCDANSNTFVDAVCGGNDTSDPIFNYKVRTGFSFNTPPTVTTNPPSYSDLCSQPLAVYLPWYYSDPDTMDGYQIQIKIDGTNWDELPLVIDQTVEPTGGLVPQYAFTAPDIAYGTTYNWRVKVKDSQDAWSIAWADGSDFNTALHDYPFPDFTWLPNPPSIGEDVQFTDGSSAYGVGVSITSWLWTFINVSEVDGNAVPPASNTSLITDPVVKFSSTAGATAQLMVRDSTGYSCSTTKNITAKKKLPSWIETK